MGSKEYFRHSRDGLSLKSLVENRKKLLASPSSCSTKRGKLGCHGENETKLRKKDGPRKRKYVNYDHPGDFD